MHSSRILVAALFLFSPLALASEPVNIGQFEQIFKADHGLHDELLSKQLAGFSLTERVTAQRLARWEAESPGPDTQQILLLLADESAFYPLPASDLSSDSPPDHSTEKVIFGAALKYAGRAIQNLPNFFAVRRTLHYETSLDTVLKQAQGDTRSNTHFIGRDLALYYTGEFTDTVTYRGRKEVSTDDATAPTLGLITSGEFGPFLTLVLNDAEHGSVVWGYWHQQGNIRLAVFRYSVPAAKSHWVVELYGARRTLLRPAYHGEIAVDPDTGSILRISIVSDPSKQSDPASGLLIEYGSVILGGRSYIVPVHAVAYGRVPIILGPDQAAIPVQTYLNDVTFNRYRLFRADAHILSPEETRQLRYNGPSTLPPAPQSR